MRIVLMVYQSFELPPAPDAPLSIFSMVKRAAQAYRTLFAFSMKLFWLPSLITTLGGLPIMLMEAPESLSWQTMVSFCSAIALALLTVLYYSWLSVKRGLVLKRMVLVPEESCIPSLAFSNRLGWKAVVARFATGAFQLCSAFVFISLGLLAWCNNERMGGAMHFQPLPELSLAVIAIIVALTALSYCCWFVSEFFYMCFSVVLATESSDWTTLWQRSCQLSRSALFRGSNFAFAEEFTMWLLPVLFSPLTLFNLSAAARNGFHFAHTAPPVWITLTDSLIAAIILLIATPYVIILNAYFANDVRVRFQARAAGAQKQ